MIYMYRYVYVCVSIYIYIYITYIYIYIYTHMCVPGGESRPRRAAITAARTALKTRTEIAS